MNTATDTAATPLTVAYIGNFRHAWCTEVHVAASLRSLGHTVVQLQEDQLQWEQLPELAAQAHLVLWTRTWPAELDRVLPVLARLRDQRIPTVSYHLDRWWGLDREHQVADQPFFHTDLVVSPDGGNDHRWAEAGVRHLYLPPGVYAAECTPVPAAPKSWPHDVVFVGTLPYPHQEWHPYRQQLVDTLRAHFGRRFGHYPVARGRPVRGKALQSLYATAKVVVGDSCLAGGATHYWSDRVPETLGRGGLLIHPEVEGLADWYRSPAMGDGDLLTYPLGDFDQVLAWAEWALDHPTDAREVAEHGRATVLGRDTYAHRMTTVLEHVEEHLGLGRGPLAQPAAKATPADAPATIRVRHRRHRGIHATFQLADGDPDNVAVWEVWQDDTYQLQTEWVRNQVVVDVGANLGSFSVLAAKLGASRVHAYEPLPRIAQVAEANVAANGLAGRVTVHRAAVGAKAGTGWLADVAAGGAHLAGDDEDGTEVAVVGINELLAELPEVGLLKVDCEGGEFDIIGGIDPEQLAKVAHIAMEFHGPGMPHLTHLAGAPQWGAMVAKLAEQGRVRTMGRPSVGGLLWWDRY